MAIDTAGFFYYYLVQPLQLNLQYILYYLTVLFGAIITQILALSRGFEGSKEFLKRFYPTLSERDLFRLDFFLLTVIGSIIGFILFDPKDYKQALLAGIGWITSIQSFARGTQSTDKP